MGAGAGWRVATVVLAAATAVLLWRDVTRPPAEPPSPVDATAAPQRERLPSPAPRRREPPAPRGDVPPADAEPPAPAAATPPAGQTVAAKDETTADLVLRLALSGTWTADFPALEARRDEAVSLLERLVRNSKACTQEGVNVAAVLDAYVRLAGAAAIPVLERQAAEDPPVLPLVAAVLARVDDPEAVAALRRLQAGLGADVSGIEPHVLLAGTPASRALVREWTEAPPANQPWFGERCRQALFLAGKPEEKEWTWRAASPEERERLLGWVAPISPPPWPDRLLAGTREGLGSADPWVRARAIQRVAQWPAFFGAESFSRAETLARADADRARSAADAQLESYLRSARAQFDRAAADRVREARVRALVEGR